MKKLMNILNRKNSTFFFMTYEVKGTNIKGNWYTELKGSNSERASDFYKWIQERQCESAKDNNVEKTDIYITDVKMYH